MSPMQLLLGHIWKSNSQGIPGQDNSCVASLGDPGLQEFSGMERRALLRWPVGRCAVRACDCQEGGPLTDYLPRAPRWADDSPDELQGRVPGEDWAAGSRVGWGSCHLWPCLGASPSWRWVCFPLGHRSPETRPLPLFLSSCSTLGSTCLGGGAVLFQGLGLGFYRGSHSHSQ